MSGGPFWDWAKGGLAAWRPLLDATGECDAGIAAGPSRPTDGRFGMTPRRKKTEMRRAREGPSTPVRAGGGPPILIYVAGETLALPAAGKFLSRGGLVMTTVNTIVKSEIFAARG